MSFKSPHSPKLTDKLISNEKTQILFDDYEGSEFEYGAEDKNEKKTFKRSYDSQAKTSSHSSLPSKDVLKDEQSKTEGQIRGFHYRSMNAYAKHIKLVNDYLQYYSGGKTLKEVFARDTSKDKTDLDVIREEMKFIWDESDEPGSWEQRLAKRYYDKLFKEYCLCDLTYYKQNKVAMRWRIEKEVITGKGQFICGEKKCPSREGLKTWEVNFGYVEHGEKKNALVKLRLCPDCSLKLNFHHKKKEYVKPVKQKLKKKEIEEKEKSSDSSESDDNKEENDDQETTKSKKLKKSAEKETKKDESEEAKVSSDGNMIILNADDSMWKSSSDKQLASVEDSKAREDEFEDYLEDLFL